MEYMGIVFLVLLVVVLVGIALGGIKIKVTYTKDDKE